MKKILALILCLAMVFSFTAVLAGCGDEEEDTKDKTSDVDKDTEKADDEDSEEGDEDVEDADLCNTWEGNLDLAPLFSELYGALGSTQGLPEEYIEIMIPDEFKVVVSLELTEDEYVVSLDVDTFEDALSDYIDDVIDDVVDFAIDYAEEERGMTEEEFLANANVSSKKEFKELYASQFKSSMSSLITEHSDEMMLGDSGEYTIKGNKIVLDEFNSFTFKIRGNKMTGTWNIVNDESGIDVKMPFTFNVQ